jgi:MoxR-like ATPase
VLTSSALGDLQRLVDEVYVDPALIEYAVRMVSATRAPEEHGIREIGRYITYGASPRASINLILSAKALAFVRGRQYALPQDVLDMALDVMRHRLVLSYEALTDDVTTDDLLRTIIARIPVPVVPLHGHSDIRVSA